jgi:hypothetical protein
MLKCAEFCFTTVGNGMITFYPDLVLTEIAVNEAR